MPVMDGFEATKILRNKIESHELRDVVIIACTALQEEQYKRKCFECGMNAYL